METEEYLNEALGKSYSHFFVALKEVVVKKYGLLAMAKHIGVDESTIRKSLTTHRSPKFTTVMKICDALGFRFSIHGK